MYTTRLAQYQCRWDAQFEEYYTKEINPDSIHSTARWRLEQLVIYNPYSGVTNNQSESLNRVIKAFQGWREAPIDCIDLALHQLQIYFLYEIRRVFAGVGEYHIAKSFNSIKLDRDAVEYLPSCSPEKIVDSIRKKKEDGRYTPQSIITGEATDGNEEEKDQGEEDQSDPEKHNENRTLSSVARVRIVLRNNLITFDPKVHAFNIKGTSGNIRVATLFPRETCSCPSTGTCYHIIAAKMSLGVSFANEPTKRNLTQLRRNTRKRQEKKSGRKRPRPTDADPEIIGKPCACAMCCGYPPLYI